MGGAEEGEGEVGREGLLLTRGRTGMGLWLGNEAV